jgi:hypothetical protein
MFFFNNEKGSHLASLRNKYLYLLAIFLLCMFHRIYLLIINKPYLDLHYLNNSTWLTWQFFKFDILTNELFKSILYLQQQPPLPTLILGVILKIFSGAQQIMYSLIILEAVFTSLTACFIYMILKNYWKNRKFIAVFCIIFRLSLDIIVIEYNSLGQTFYGILTMLMMTVILFQFYRSLMQSTIQNYFFI